jgi:type I restriction enzyme S subunit
MTSDWIKVKFHDAIELVGGGTPKTTESNYWNGSIPWLSVADFNNVPRWVSDAEKSITELGLKQSSTKLLNAGDIIISARGTVGAIAQLSRPMAFNQSCYGVRGISGVSDTNFIFYALKYAVQSLKQLAHGGVFDTITRDTFKSIDLLLPSKTEQQRIAELLGSLDDRITLLRETNKTLEAIAQAIFKSWFIDFDPVRAKMEGRAPAGPDEETAALFPDELVDSELGLVPKGWGVEGLDQVANYLNGLALQKFPPTGHDDLPVIKIAQLRKGDTIGADRASRALKPEYIVKDGDVLFSWSGSLEVEIWCGGEGALNQHLFKVTSEKFEKWFYFLWTRKHLEHFRQIAASKATTMGHIQRSHLSDAKVIVPDEKVLAVANDLFSPIVDRITSNALQAKTLAEIRDGLLPRLISGKLRLSGSLENVA